VNLSNLEINKDVSILNAGRHWAIPVIAIFLFLLLSGCVSTRHYVTKREMTFIPRESSQVEFVTRESITDRDYFEIGKVEIDFKPERISNDSLEWLYEQMKSIAGENGADAISDFRIDSLDDKHRKLKEFTAYGTAIRFLDIYERGEWPDRSYLIMGRVFGSFEGQPMFPGTREKVLELIRPVAAELDADAILDLYFSNQGELGKMPYGRWGSGLAVRYIDSRERKHDLEIPKFIVGIRPWGHLNKNEDSIRIHLGVFLSSAQYYLEQSGFHAYMGETPVSYRDIDSLFALREKGAPLEKSSELLFGRDTEYILFLDKGVRMQETTGELTSPTDYIHAHLVSKSSGRTIWEKSIPVAFDIMERLYDGGNFRADYNREMSEVYLAAGELFQSLPNQKFAAARVDGNDNWTPSSLSADETGTKEKFAELLANAEEFLAYDAVITDRVPEIAEMLDRGVDINTRGYNGNTLLHAAVVNGNKEMVKFLLSRRADPELKNAEGLTPLELADRLHTPDYDLSGVKQLLKGYTAME